MLGVYGSIASNTHYGWYQMALPASDDMHFTARTNNANMIHDVAHYKVGVSNTWIQNLWQMKYQAIDRANLAIAGI